MGRRTTIQIDAQMLHDWPMRVAVRNVSGSIARIVVTTRASAGMNGIVIVNMPSCQGAMLQYHSCRRAIDQIVQEWQGGSVRTTTAGWTDVAIVAARAKGARLAQIVGGLSPTFRRTRKGSRRDTSLNVRRARLENNWPSRLQHKKESR